MLNNTGFEGLHLRTINLNGKQSEEWEQGVSSKRRGHELGMWALETVAWSRGSRQCGVAEFPDEEWTTVRVEAGEGEVKDPGRPGSEVTASGNWIPGHAHKSLVLVSFEEILRPSLEAVTIGFGL